MKICSCCSIEKAINNFPFRKDQNKYRNICKDCANRKNKQRFSTNSESYIKKLESSRKYSKSKKGKQNKKEYRESPENKAKRRIYCKNRWENDIEYRMLIVCRNRLRHAMKGIIKDSNTLTLLGCSIKEFNNYIESLWEPGMSWENYGLDKNKWNIDHILCCELFDFTNPKQQSACFHFSNTKPAWHTENQSKCDLLDNGLRARNLSKEEKLKYLKDKGMDFTECPTT